MSTDDHRGAAWGFKRLMQQAQDEIDRGERKGATRIWKTAHPAKTYIGRFAARILRMRSKRQA